MIKVHKYNGWILTQYPQDDNAYGIQMEGDDEYSFYVGFCQKLFNEEEAIEEIKHYLEIKNL